MLLECGIGEGTARRRDAGSSAKLTAPNVLTGHIAIPTFSFLHIFASFGPSLGLGFGM